MTMSAIKAVTCSMCEVQVTIGCNNRCVYCYAGSNEKSARNEMSMKMFKNICQRLAKEVNGSKFTLTGGEPTTHSRFNDLVVYSREILSDWRLHLQTNGRRFAKMKNALFIASAGVDSVNISFQSLDSDTHDRLDGVNGAHSEVVQAIVNLLEVSEKYGRPEVNVNITLSEANAPEFEKTLNFLFSLGVKGVSTNIMRVNRNQENMETFCLHDSQAASYFQRGYEVGNLNGKGFKNLHSFNLCQHDPFESGLFHYSCAVGKELMSIDHEGNLTPCPYISDSEHKIPGNLNDDIPISDIWHGDIFNKYRNHGFTHSACKSCERIDECGGVCVAIKDVVRTEELHPF